MKQVYLDHAATTYVRPEVKAAMEPYFSEIFGNPSSFHAFGLKSKEALDAARGKIAKILNCKSEEIIFTGGGTESINLALKGVAFANKSRGNHIVTQKTEHHAVLHTCEWLEKQGFDITYLDVDEFGIVNPADIENAITGKTILVTIMYANNEIGTIQPISEIGEICRKKGIYFHTDACQAAGALDIDVQKLNADLLTINGSKIYGPKGVGLLYVRKCVLIEPVIHGGGQENRMRAGTENVPGIVGLAKALELAQAESEIENTRIINLRNKLVAGILEKISDSRLNGHPGKRLPNNANISILGIEGEALLLHLSEKGVYASTGSACTSSSLDPSHVLTSIGLPYELAHGSIRFTLGKATTDADINYVLEILPAIVEKLRLLSPVKIKMQDLSERKKISYREKYK